MMDSVLEAGEVVELPVRRARGLRFPVLPSGALLAQVGGGIAAAVGLYGAAGPWITLLVGGAVVTVLGMLREAGKV